MLLSLRPSSEGTDDPSTLPRSLFRDGSWLIFHCARLSHPPAHWHAKTCH